MNELRTRDRIGARGTWLPVKVASKGPLPVAAVSTASWRRLDTTRSLALPARREGVEPSTF
jgi:hypothetical protein